MSNLNETIGTLAYDNLIVDINPPADVFTVKVKQLAEAATLKRGTVLAKGQDGKMYVLGMAGKNKAEFNGDGSTKTFTLTAKPHFLNGLKVGDTDATGYTYDPVSGVITFTTAPTAGTKNVVATYDEIVANCILADDVSVGTSADATALAYRTGHFNGKKLIVAEGYTLSAADKENLRDLGILISDAMAY